MDPEAIAGMVFTLILISMIGGFILIAPLTKRLGALLEQKVQNQGASRDPQAAREIAQLREQLAALEQQVTRLKDRQDFSEQLVAENQRKSLPEAR